MLKARLPTQQELTDLYREVENLRKDKKLKDDTIKFLQKEKEALMREVSFHHINVLLRGYPCNWDLSSRQKSGENSKFFLILSPIR